MYAPSTPAAPRSLDSVVYPLRTWWSWPTLATQAEVASSLRTLGLIDFPWAYVKPMLVGTVAFEEKDYALLVYVLPAVRARVPIRATSPGRGSLPVSVRLPARRAADAATLDQALTAAAHRPALRRGVGVVRSSQDTPGLSLSRDDGAPSALGGNAPTIIDDWGMSAIPSTSGPMASAYLPAWATHKTVTWACGLPGGAQRGTARLSKLCASRAACPRPIRAAVWITQGVRTTSSPSRSSSSRGVSHSGQ